MAVIKVGNNSIGKISVIEPYDDPTNNENLLIDYEPDFEPWVRPSEWLDMPVINSGEHKAAILMFVPSGVELESRMYLRGAYNQGYKTYAVIDWGDGESVIHSGYDTNTNSINYMAPKYHTYRFENLPPESEFIRNGHPCRQAMLQIDGSVSGIEYLETQFLNNAGFYPDSRNQQSSTVLDMHIECPDLTSLGTQDGNYGYHRNLERLVINATGVFYPSYLCYEMRNLRSFSMPNVDAFGTVNIEYMFGNCLRLTEIPPLPDFSSAISLAGMFSNCKSLRAAPSIDTSSCENFASMFYRCTSLREIPNYDFSNATRMDSTFNELRQITTIPSGLSCPNVTNINSMFYNCENLSYVPENLFDNFTNVTSAQSTFWYCQNLKSLPKIDLPNCSNMYQFAYNCISLEKIELGDLRNMKNGTLSRGFRQAFSSCLSVKKITVQYPEETWSPDMGSMFSITSIKTGPNINTASGEYLAGFLSSCYNLRTAPVYDVSNAYHIGSFYNNCRSLTKIGGFKFGQNRNLIYGERIFYDCVSLREFPSGLFQDYASTPSYPYDVFRNTQISSIPDVNLSGVDFNTTNIYRIFSNGYIRDVGNMVFGSGANLRSFMTGNVIEYLPDWDVSGVIDLTAAFTSNQSLAWSDIRNTSCDVGYQNCLLGSGAIEHIFNNLASGVTGKTIDIRDNYGGDLLHSDTIAIATSKGWTVTT